MERQLGQRRQSFFEYANDDIVGEKVDTNCMVVINSLKAVFEKLKENKKDLNEDEQLFIGLVLRGYHMCIKCSKTEDSMD